MCASSDDKNMDTKVEPQSPIPDLIILDSKDGNNIRGDVDLLDEDFDIAEDEYGVEDGDAAENNQKKEDYDDIAEEIPDEQEDEANVKGEDFELFAKRCSQITKLCEETQRSIINLRNGRNHMHLTPSQDLDIETRKLEITKNIVQIRKIFEIITPWATAAIIANDEWKYKWFFDSTLRMYITTYIANHRLRAPRQPVYLTDLHRTIPLVTRDKIWLQYRTLTMQTPPPARSWHRRRFIR